MTLKRREELIAEENESLDEEVAKFIESTSGDLAGDRSWHFYAYSYEQAVDVMWDATYARPNTVLHPPLLFLCRQSIELSIKAGISKLSGERPPRGHNLQSLWSDLLKALKKLGQPTNDAFSESVGWLINLLDQHDQIGDRFRYPDSKQSGAYPSTVVDLEKLYRAHWRVMVYCYAVYHLE